MTGETVSNTYDAQNRLSSTVKKDGTSNVLSDTANLYNGDKQDPSSLHLYAYTANNPINFTDPSGHWGEIHQELTKKALKGETHANTFDNVKKYYYGGNWGNTAKAKNSRLNSSTSLSKLILRTFLRKL